VDKAIGKATKIERLRQLGNGSIIFPAGPFVVDISSIFILDLVSVGE
jgi:hypothetical protein